MNAAAEKENQPLAAVGHSAGAGETSNAWRHAHVDSVDSERSQAADALGRERGWRRILVAVELNSDARKLVRYAAELAGREHTLVCLLHVIDQGPFVAGVTESPLCKEPEQMSKTAQRYLRRLAHRELPGELQVRILVRRGRTAREVVNAARGICADLILLASPRQNWLSRLFSGDPTRWIESNAPCSVVALREANYAACNCPAEFESRPPTPTAVPA